MSKVFKVGVGREIISPPKGVKLYGYPSDRPNEGVRDDLTINAIAFSNGKETGIMMSADLCSLEKSLIDKMREGISVATGVEKLNICISATHTHSGPIIATVAGWGEADDSYIVDILIPQSIKAAKSAYESMIDAVMGVSTVDSYVGMNRRQYSEKGGVGLGQNPFGIFDKTMTVLAFKDLDGNNIVNMIHYGCHGTAVGGELLVTRDWPGVMVDRLETTTGAITVFFNGSEGDVGPRLSNGMTWGTHAFEEMEEIGSLAALDATRAYRQIKEYREVDFKLVKGQITLPYEPLLTEDAVQKRLDEINAMPNLHDIYIREKSSLETILKMYKDKTKIETEKIIDQTMFAFNSTIFVPFQFEMFSSIALRLRQFSPYQNTLCTCLTNASDGYLPAQEDLIRGGYEVAMFKGDIYKLKDNTDTTIIQENLRIMRENQ